jgi:hypothetical protein
MDHLNMKQLASQLLVLIGLTPIIAHAQCDVVISFFTINTPCGDHPGAEMFLSGGTPPYSLTLTTDLQAQTTYSDVPEGLWNGQFFTDPYDTQVTVTVTDALNCSASASQSFIQYHILTPQLSYTPTCATTGGLLWSGYFENNQGFPPPSCIPEGPFDYTITNLSTLATSTGSITSDWIQEPSAQWRYPGPLEAGLYLVNIFPHADLPVSACPYNNSMDCFNAQQVHVTVSPGDCGVNVRLRTALAGALPTGTVMTDHLRASGLLPLVEPYCALGYSFTGTSPGIAVAPSMFNTTGNQAIVDWVIVEVRQPSAPFAILHSRPALLQRDGNVIDADGSSYINAPLPPGTYRFTVRHRNHLGVMTGPLACSLDPTNTLIDLRSTSTSTFGTNALTTVGPLRCMWPGNTNFDGQVRYSGTGNDRDVVLIAVGGSTPSNTSNNVYSAADINLDGVVKYTGPDNDRDIILQTIGGTVPTAVRVQQLP